MSRTRIRLAALVGVVCISFSAIFVRLADTAPTTITVFRALYAIPVLGFLWLAVRRRDRRPMAVRLVAFTAGLILAIDLTFWHISIEQIGAGLATVLANIQVLFVGGIAWLLYGERPTRAALVLVPVMLAGVVLISGLGRADAYGANPRLGVVLGVLAGLSYAGFIVVLRSSNRASLAPAPGPLLDATLGTAVGGFVIGPFFADFSLSVTWPGHGWILAIAVLGQSLGWLLITVALPRLPALETSVMILAQPMLALLWAQLIFSERLSSVQWSGAALVLAGLLFLSLRGTVRPPTTEGVPAPAAAET